MMNDIQQAIVNKKIHTLAIDRKFEQLKLTLCMNLTRVYEVISASYTNLGERLSIILHLDREEQEMLEKIALLDLDIKEISANIKKIDDELVNLPK